ncbi:tectonin beta-propeller repeat-containing protein-like isoform X3 [Ceratina calcarata]|uniref:Galectin n=1 Tax=Ceratina calcarata TaxID=156304 RepID=A0AAJ7NE04_9HYME|nr:tectonin beta-propeller repeat-containing protein-like isoform X3 [Ceratina calcarata]
MSANQDEVFVQTKENAHREFSFVDEDAASLSTSTPVPLQPLKPTSAIVVTGYVPPDASRFSVNLWCKTGGNIALHLNARLDRGYVVRNSKSRGRWEEEETCSPAAQTAFRRNSYVHILIFCTSNEYQATPITVDIEDELKPGTRLLIAGRLKLLPHSFYVNLQEGKAIYPHPVIPLHLNPRFSYGSSAPYVVMNCWTDGSWGHEERHSGHLSWMPGRDFLLTIRCEEDAYTIWLDDKMIGEFRHRSRPSIVDTLKIHGDVVLHELATTRSK